MSTVNDESLTDREEGRKLYEESDKLLCLAERLLDKCEQYERRLWLLIAICLTSAAFGGLAVYLNTTLPNDSIFKTLQIPLSVIYAFGVFYVCYITRRTSRHLVRERRALYSIVDMLRDLEKGIAEKDNLSTLERAEFRIRLSRFDIGPGH
jgi:hypothetical protein